MDLPLHRSVTWYKLLFLSLKRFIMGFIYTHLILTCILIGIVTLVKIGSIQQAFILILSYWSDWVRMEGEFLFWNLEPTYSVLNLFSKWQLEFASAYCIWIGYLDILDLVCLFACFFLTVLEIFWDCVLIIGQLPHTGRLRR